MSAEDESSIYATEIYTSKEIKGCPFIIYDGHKDYGHLSEEHYFIDNTLPDVKEVARAIKEHLSTLIKESVSLDIPYTMEDTEETLTVVVDNIEEMTEDIETAITNDNLSLFFNDNTGEYYMWDIVKDNVVLTFKKFENNTATFSYESR